MNFARPEHVPGKCKPVFRKRHANAQESESTAQRDLTKSGCVLAISAAVLVALSASCAQAVPALATKNVNMRQGAGTNYPIVTTIPGGSTVDVTGCQGQWCTVVWQGQTGYSVAMSFDQGAGDAGPPPGTAGPPQGFEGPPGAPLPPVAGGPVPPGATPPQPPPVAGYPPPPPGAIAEGPIRASPPGAPPPGYPLPPPGRAIIHRRATILTVPITAPTAITGPIGVGRGGEVGRG
jgi:hypothetical protein